MSRVRRVYLATLAAAAVWLAAIVLAPFLLSRGSHAATFLYACFSRVCHQAPERSFFLFGCPLAVCARCTGIYTGALAALVLLPAARGLRSLRPPRIGLFLAASAPLALDGAAGLLGLWDSPGLLRFATGFLRGAFLPGFFVSGIADLLASRSRPAGPREAGLHSSSQNP